MLSVLGIVLPIFALILAGWLVRRLGVLGPHAMSEINRFVVYLALPALLFDIVTGARWADVWQPGFIAAFGLGVAGVFVVTVLLLRGRHGLADAAIDGLNASYANVGFVGFPLLVAVLGPAALAPTLVATLLTVCVLFGVALILIEVGLQTERHPGRLLLKVASALVRNPLLVAPLLGALLLAAGVAVPAPLGQFVHLLGAAASPCALVALGLFLAETRTAPEGSSRRTATLVGVKLLVQPALTWWLAAQVFQLSPWLTQTAVLLAALPTGTGPFMVAAVYGRDAGVTARVVLLSTLGSLLTITLYLSLVPVAMPTAG